MPGVARTQSGADERSGTQRERAGGTPAGPAPPFASALPFPASMTRFPASAPRSFIRISLETESVKKID